VAGWHAGAGSEGGDEEGGELGGDGEWEDATWMRG
jgi:hypothetical protein